MKFLKLVALACAAASLAGCVAGVDAKYSDRRIAAAEGFPELARQLGQVRKDCVLQASDWEPVFVQNNITTGRRVSNALTGMQSNGQIAYFKDKRVIAVAAEFCAG